MALHRSHHEDGSDYGEWVDMHWKYCAHANVPNNQDNDNSGDNNRDNNWKMKNSEEELTEKSWREVDFNHIREEAARAILVAESNQPSLLDAVSFVEDAWEHWDKFYQINENRFFRDRNYLHLEFPELNPFNIDRDSTPAFLEREAHNTHSDNGESADIINNQVNSNNNSNKNNSNNKTITNSSSNTYTNNYKTTVMEVGCGAGNTLFPLIRLNPDKYFYAFDFSPHAVEIVQSNPQYDQKRVTAFVHDPNETLPEIIQENSVDYALMVFFLSAVPVEKMVRVLRNVYKVLKPGGAVFFRDYALYDLTQMRFISKKSSRKIAENCYARADGTLSYFFSKEILEKLFQEAGFKTNLTRYDTRELRNRKRKISMYRVWIQGKFTRY